MARKCSLENIPENFVSLDALGFPCFNYYAGSGGKTIDITDAELKALGMHADLWVHQNVIEPLKMARRIIRRQGFDILVKDAWRPSRLYDLIIEKRIAKNLSVAHFNPQDKPHARGVAIDMVLTDMQGNELPMRRHEDGDAAYYIDFYADKAGEEAATFHLLQWILINASSDAGFDLGSRREYWHFQLPGFADYPVY